MLLSLFTSDPKKLILQAGWMLRKIPVSLQHRLHAGIITRNLLKLMPTNLQLSVSDPISAMVIAALNFLSTPAGQVICGDVRSVLVDLIKHVHGKMATADIAAPMAPVVPAK